MSVRNDEREVVVWLTEEMGGAVCSLERSRGVVLPRDRNPAAGPDHLGGGD
jgi:hypothetical protein